MCNSDIYMAKLPVQYSRPNYRRIYTYTILHYYLPKGAFQEQLLIRSITLFIITNYNTQLKRSKY